MKKRIRVMLVLMMMVICTMAMARAVSAEGEPTVTVPVEISLSGTLPATSEDFVVKMEAQDVSNPMPEGSENGVCTLTISGAGSQSFPAMTFRRVGIYTYKISQVAGSNERCTYDNTIYTLTVSVINAEDGSGIESVTVLHSNTAEGKQPNALFANEYELENAGVIRVTKELYDTHYELPYSPPTDEEVVFYVGLFSDEACTQQVPGTTDMPLSFVNSSSATAVFENLLRDATYYIAETDGNGNAVASVAKDDIVFLAVYPQGQAVTVTREAPEASISFRNETNGLPDGFAYVGSLYITKETVRGGQAYPTDEVFYAGIFYDPEYTEIASEVIELPMNGESSITVKADVVVGQWAEDSVTYYITETDKDGKPINSVSGLSYTMSIDLPDGKVTMSPQNIEAAVKLTNTFEEETQTEPETQEPSEEEPPTEPETQKPTEPETPKPVGKTTDQPTKTGDETPIALYLCLMLASLCIVITVIAISGRRRKKQSR